MTDKQKTEIINRVLDSIEKIQYGALYEKTKISIVFRGEGNMMPIEVQAQMEEHKILR